MLTLTLDPQLFPAGPASAYANALTHRCVAVAIQHLRRHRHLASDRHLVVTHFNRQGWPHWHVLVDAKGALINKLNNFSIAA